MNIVIIIISSILVFAGIRCILLLSYSLVGKVFRISLENDRFELGISIILFITYLYFLCKIVLTIIGLIDAITILDWFLIYTYMGVSAILWCYFSWELKWKAIPKFGQNDEEIILKKIIVFTLVLIFAFYHGYQQLSKSFDANYDEEKGMLVMISNATIIPGIIALDRVLNQVKSYIQLKKKSGNMLDMPTIRVTAAIIKSYTTDNQPIIFATQRGYGDFAGGWEFPGGKIEEGETPQEALVREIKEELDTEIKVGDLIDTIEYDYPNFHLSMDCFWCEIVSGDLILKEHEAAKWLKKDELDSVEWLPADITLIEKIKDVL